jgi:hypothetical protein
MPIPSRGPWLTGGLCCPPGSMLTTASSEPLPPARQLMNSLSSPPTRRTTGGGGGVPHFTRRICPCVPSPGPRWAGRLHPAVASPTVSAFANSVVARRPHAHARRFPRESCNEADRFACATARKVASPHRQGTFTIELPPAGSPRTGVDYDYAGKQPIPATGLAPARYSALWAANGRHGEHGREGRRRATG